MLRSKCVAREQLMRQYQIVSDVLSCVRVSESTPQQLYVHGHGILFVNVKRDNLIMNSSISFVFLSRAILRGLMKTM